MIKLAFHDTDIFADIAARIVARMSARRSACHRNNSGNNSGRVGRVGEDPREDVCVGVGVGVVEFQLNRASNVTPRSLTLSAHFRRELWPKTTLAITNQFGKIYEGHANGGQKEDCPIVNFNTK